MFEKTLESLLDCKEIKPVNPKGSQPWIFTGRADAEAPTLWPPDEKSWLAGKNPDAGKDCRQDEMVGWHHWISGHELEQTPRDSEGQGSLVCCSSWVCEELDMMEWLNNEPRAGIWAPEPCYFKSGHVPAPWASLRSLLEMENLRPCQAQLIRICISTRSSDNSLALGRLRTPGETGG